MRILAIDTSTRRGSIALVQGDVVAAALEDDGTGHHAESIVGLIDRAVAIAAWPKQSIELVACGQGPGSFTGVRVALATAKGIALGLGRPIVGIGSLDAMAAACQAPAPIVVAVIDARKGELFWQAFDASGKPLAPPTHSIPADFAEAIAPLVARGAVVVGEVAATLGLDAPVARHPLSDLPDARSIASLAAARFSASGPDDLATLEPTYVRPPDIQLPRGGGAPA